MNDPSQSQSAVSAAGNQPSVVIQQIQPPRRSWIVRFLFISLIFSMLFNFTMYSQVQQHFSVSSGPLERFHSGDALAENKIAVIEVSGTIMPPFTSKILKAIKKATDDDLVKGVLLSIDSPGGLVADSHQIYHELTKLRKKKPMVVAMKRIAASGGYYVAMGAGENAKIFAEPTTWTGSIGVIIPRFDFTKIVTKYGIESDPLKTGKFKDALSPFRPLTAEERDLWMHILDDSFSRFKNLIVENRKPLDAEQVSELATGEVFTSTDSLKNGLIDEIGFEEDALESLKTQLGLEKVRVINYYSQPTLWDVLLGSMQAKHPETRWKALLEATVPKAMYYCSWAPGIPTW